MRHWNWTGSPSRTSRSFIGSTSRGAAWLVGGDGGLAGIIG